MKILVLGTFNPDIPGGPSFFYGRPRNYLWQLLPACYGLPTLRNAMLAEKQAFMAQYRIDFADIIHSVNVPAGQEKNVEDTYIDSHIFEMKNITTLIHSRSSIESVYFTRKTFHRIPNIESAIAGIRDFCIVRCIRFCLLETPARFANAVKQQQWIDTIALRQSCI